MTLATEERILRVVTIAPELEATGWTAVDETGRYLRHEARFGPAIFDHFEAASMEGGRGKKLRDGLRAPRRAPACRCNPGIADRGTCVKCGRRVA